MYDRIRPISVYDRIRLISVITKCDVSLCVSSCVWGGARGALAMGRGGPVAGVRSETGKANDSVQS